MASTSEPLAPLAVSRDVPPRLGSSLSHPVGLAIAGGTVLLCAALWLLPALAPWAARTLWVALWGAAVYLSFVLLMARRPSVPVRQPAAPDPPPAVMSVPTSFQGLTQREVEVLRLLAGGQTNRQIAAALVISVATAERHISNIYAKIGARGRADAAAFALRHHLAA